MFGCLYSGILSPPVSFLTPSPSPSVPASPRLQPSPSLSPFPPDTVLLTHNTITNTTADHVSVRPTPIFQTWFTVVEKKNTKTSIIHTHRNTSPDILPSYSFNTNAPLTAFTHAQIRNPHASSSKTPTPPIPKPQLCVCVCAVR